jgi:hypothetical protein
MRSRQVIDRADIFFIYNAGISKQEYVPRETQSYRKTLVSL